MNAFEDLCELCTIGGLADLYRARHLTSKIFWTVMLVGLLGITVWQTKGTFDDYFRDGPFETKVSVDNQFALNFPNITVCNFNRVRQSFVDQYEIHRRALYYAFGTIMENYNLNLETFNEWPDISEFENAWVEFTKRSSISTVSELLNLGGHSCDTTFLRCEFAGQDYNCCSSVEVKINGYGKCFLLSPPMAKKQTVPGRSGGLRVVLNPHFGEYLVNVTINNYLEEGFVLGIGYVYEPQIANPIVLKPNSHTWISLGAGQAVYKRSLYPVYTPTCRTDPQLTVLNEMYTKANCYFDCKSFAAVKRCGCAPLADNLKPGFRVCNGTEAYMCINNAENPTNNTAECLQKCVDLCEPTNAVTATFITTTQLSIAANEAVRVKLEQKFRNIDRNDKAVDSVVDTLVADIYFSSLELSTVSTTEATPIFIFLSNIGGQLGLWSGITVVTIIQLIYYSVALIFPLTKKQSQRVSSGNTVKAKIYDKSTE